MTRITTLIAALALLLAACGGVSNDSAEDGSDAATTEATPATSTTQPAPETTLPAAPASPGIEAKVVFDGETCVYQGPLVVPDGVEMTFDFEATARPEHVALVVVRVVDGTTWEQITHDADTIPASTDNIPSWVKVNDLNLRATPGSLTVPLEVGNYAVTCNTSPTDTDRVHPAALIETMSEVIEANVVFDGNTCSYDGPPTVPSGARVNFVLEATARPDHVALVVMGVVDGTTWEEVTHDAGSIPASVPEADIPSWVELDDLDTLIGPGSMEKVLDGGTYLVSCNTSPDDTDRVYPATFIDTTTN